MNDRNRQKTLVFMTIASDLSALGTCERKQVGTVIVRDGRCISWGFNGAPPGLPHCDENEHGWRPRPNMEAVYLADELSVDDGLTVSELGNLASTRWGCKNATHAEANALAAAARQGISTDGGSLFTTCSPCDTCSRLIIAAGIIHVYFLEEYRDRSGVELLLAAGITVEHIT